MAEAEERVLDYVRQFVPEPRKAPLAGNTIGTDRAFLARDMPTLEAHVHYRNVDVSSIKELARRWYPRVYYPSPAKSGNHRALADIQESIEELRYYREAVFVPRPGPDSATAAEIAARHQGALTGRSPTAPPADQHRVDRPSTLSDRRAGRDAPTRIRRQRMVGVAQLVEHLVVVQVVAGSSPVTHPIRTTAPDRVPVGGCVVLRVGGRPAPGGSALGAVPHHEHRAGGVAHALVADRAQHHLAQPAHAPGADDEHPGLAGGVDEGPDRTRVVGRQVTSTPGNAAAGARTSSSSSAVTAAASSSVEGTVPKVQPGGRGRRDHRPGPDDGDRRAQLGGQLERRPQRTGGAVRAVVAHDQRGRGGGLDVVGRLGDQAVGGHGATFVGVPPVVQDRRPDGVSAAGRPPGSPPGRR